MTDIAIIWFVGFIFIAGTQYHKTTRGDILGNAMLLVKIFFCWPKMFIDL